MTTNISTLHPADNGSSRPALATRPARSARDEQEARRARDIVSLLNRHVELRGVHAMADFIDDAVRWTA